jgi:RNA polymerase sigma-70 factor (ECF subfamily)
MDPFVQELTSLIPFVRICVHRGFTDYQDIEDVVQTVLTRAFERRRTYRSELPMKPWLAQIVRRCAIDFLRAKMRYSDIREQVAAKVDLAVHISGGQEEHLELQTLLRTLATMSASTADAVLEVAITGESTRIISQRTGINQGTLKSRVSRGRAVLRAAIG